MKLKKYFLTLLLVGLVIFGVTNMSYLKSLSGTFAGVESSVYWLFLVACIIQLAGHWFRMLRTKQIIDQVKNADTRGQFEALATGYLYNVLFPFRIGELIRAFLISVRLNISFLYTLMAVLLERAVDLILISIFVIILAFWLSGTTAMIVLFMAAAALLLSVAIVVALVLLSREDKRILRVVWSVSSVLNVGLRNQFRFKVWSLIYGLQRFVRSRKAVRRYVLYSLTSWILYIASVVVLAVAILPSGTPLKITIVSIAPYIAASAPAGSSAETYNNSLSPIIEEAFPFSISTQQFILGSWILLVAPMAIIGLISIVLRNDRLVRRNRKPSSDQSYTNKLLRSDDLSQEFPAFLDNYFAGNNLAKVLHRLETSGELSLVKFFKGGSDAITILVLEDNELSVKKIIPNEYEDRLKAQYDWLVRHKKLRYLVKATSEQRTDDHYAINLEYNAENIPFFEFLHQQRVRDSIKVLRHTWEYLYEHIHKQSGKAAYYPKIRDAFINKHITGCVEKASAVDEELRLLCEQKTLIINGSKYDNLTVILDKIKTHPQAWRDIATFRKGKEVHGDMAIDNILVSPVDHKPLIIDPAPDGNLIEGPVFDLGKLAQSFYCGYEFLLRDDSPTHVRNENIINYQEQRTTQYEHLWRFVRDDLAPQYIGESEQRSLMFHAAALHLRRLKHQVNYNSENVIKFYAVGVKTLNDFLAQYE